MICDQLYMSHVKGESEAYYWENNWEGGGREKGRGVHGQEIMSFDSNSGMYNIM